MRGTILKFKNKNKITMHLQHHWWCELKMENFPAWIVNFHFGSSLLIAIDELIDMFLRRKSNLGFRR
jgi:hypothetical protein